MLDEESASGVALTGAGSAGCVSAERQQPRLCVLVAASWVFFCFFFLLPVHVAGKVRLAQYHAPESLPEVSLTAIVSPLTLAALIWCFATLKEEVSSAWPQQNISSIDPLRPFTEILYDNVIILGPRNYSSSSSAYLGCCKTIKL